MTENSLLRSLSIFTDVKNILVNTNIINTSIAALGKTVITDL